MTDTATTPVATPSTTPVADARMLALAHYAARAVLEGVLERHGATFQQSVTLRVAAVAGGSVTREHLTAEVTGSLKATPAEVAAVIGELTSAGLLAPDPSEDGPLHLTPAGRTLYDTASAESAAISARVWGGIPAEDLAAAGRVLTLVAARANAELARQRP
ncbi:MarR family transcriptional regulator [Kitasatospora sp. NPDC051853]|uniref:MarR family transcriptional regulator n=1 Tax=Kitasatospora sp. NPDC051853 TaxID=3364058 RepID=UPI0037973A4D